MNFVSGVCELFHTWEGLSYGAFAKESRASTKRCPFWVKGGGAADVTGVSGVTPTPDVP